ncbi:hypothetical protein [Sulfurovum sp. NBC37-1]|uniref:hypothetical protein n=1 Tax=Sulfurovum sp. (strain NBC37-1) TaxID=387093 RepID=UPI00031BD384|nr:hypothetical protein [Sulfurovum sp. NBC37-1]
MKKIIISTAAVATIVFGVTTLAANEGVSDSVAKKEAAALANPKMTEGEHAAKAKVEEAAAEGEFKDKMDREKFKKEAASDEKKVDEVTKVKELEAKDQAEAPKKIKAFEKEAVSDEKKTVK